VSPPRTQGNSDQNLELAKTDGWVDDLVLEASVHTFLTDNGSEFTAKDFVQRLEKLGVDSGTGTWSCPRTLGLCSS